MNHEYIFEKLLEEKREIEIIELRKDFLCKVTKYIESIDDIEKQENAVIMVTELFEKREKKILNRALYTVLAESRIKDTTNLLDFEEIFYNKLLILLDDNRVILNGAFPE